MYTYVCVYTYKKGPSGTITVLSRRRELTDWFRNSKLSREVSFLTGKPLRTKLTFHYVTHRTGTGQ